MYMTARLIAKLAPDGGSLLSKKKPATPTARKAGHIGGRVKPKCISQAGILSESGRNHPCPEEGFPASAQGPPTTARKKAPKFHSARGKVTARDTAPTRRTRPDQARKDRSRIKSHAAMGTARTTYCFDATRRPKAKTGERPNRH